MKFDNEIASKKSAVSEEYHKKGTGFMEACVALQAGECDRIINDQGVHYTIQWGIISAVEGIGYEKRDGVLCALTYRHGEGIKAPPTTFLGKWIQVKDET